MRIASRTLACLMVSSTCCLGLFLTACNGTSLTTVLDDQLQLALDQLNKNTIIVRVVNQSISDIQLDLSVDGVTQTISCSATIQVCDIALTTCPAAINALQQRSLDAQGRFVGGRNFTANDGFSFTNSQYSCDSVILYKFTETDASAKVI